jgi:hypothetical protein
MRKSCLTIAKIKGSEREEKTELERLWRKREIISKMCGKCHRKVRSNKDWRMNFVTKHLTVTLTRTIL